MYLLVLGEQVHAYQLSTNVPQWTLSMPDGRDPYDPVLISRDVIAVSTGLAVSHGGDEAPLPDCDDPDRDGWAGYLSPGQAPVGRAFSNSSVLSASPTRMLVTEGSARCDDSTVTALNRDGSDDYHHTDARTIWGNAWDNSFVTDERDLLGRKVFALWTDGGTTRSDHPGDGQFSMLPYSGGVFLSTTVGDTHNDITNVYTGKTARFEQKSLHGGPMVAYDTTRFGLYTDEWNDQYGWPENARLTECTAVPVCKDTAYLFDEREVVGVAATWPRS